jgi:hypothetical protein
VPIGTPVIVRKPSMTVSYTPDGGGAAVVIDISCAVRSLVFTESEDTQAIPTFCSPSATAVGATTVEASVSVYWTDELVDALKDHLGDEGTFTVVYNTGDTKATEFKGTIARIPFGTITPDQPIEADLTIAVSTPPARVAVTP